ncbi:MAG: 50S ribosomal protein L3 N(5)-glutamine methyltransferase [Pseudomonadota bacterium]
MIDTCGNELETAGAALDAVAAAFADAGLEFGHGAAAARDEAAWLVFAVAGLRHQDAPDAYAAPLTTAQSRRIRELAAARIETRRPLAYLLNEAWFAGLRFFVDERVLVPRSPLAELVVDGFSPWLEAERLRTALDIGTGSGCIAIALAAHRPGVHVVASDISADALAVAARNVALHRLHRLERRVELCRADVFDGVPARGFDLIISNPPYVEEAVVAALPAEFAHEPALGLAAGADGLDVVKRIIAGAHHFLSERGILVVEVGAAEAALAAAFERVPFTWLEMADGESGIFLLTKAQLAAVHGH